MLLKDQCYLTQNCKKFKNNTCTELFCPRLFAIDNLYNLGQLTEAQKQPIKLYGEPVDEAEYKRLQAIEHNIVQFVNQGTNLYIHSSICGNGKTAWAIKLLQAYVNAVWPESLDKCRILFINVPRYLLALKENITTKNEYIAQVKPNILIADLVVWDEIGVKALTEYEHEQLLNLINTRLDLRKSNIYTSNLDARGLHTCLGERLYSRVVNLSVDITFKGKDKRGMV